MKDKIAFVTGGTSGIGKSIVKSLLDKECIVITCYSSNEEVKEKFVKELGCENLKVFKCDVSKENEVAKIIGYIKDNYGQLDYLINNAGTFIDNLIKDFNIDDFRKVLDINLIGKVIPTKLVYPIMVNGGAIVNIASHLGVVPCTESPAYCAAAAGIINFTKATSLEYADKLIRVNSICPSFTPTPLAIRGWAEEEIQEKLEATPLKRLATPEDTANLCMYLLSDEASFITGENIWINGGRF